MTRSSRRMAFAAAAVSALVAAGRSWAQPTTTTPTTVKTRLGDLDFVRGFPTEQTTRKVFDEMDYQRAVQAYGPTLPR